MQTVLLTRKEAAEFLGFKKPTVLDNLIRKGFGPARVMLGARVYFKREDLQTWIEEHRIAPKQAA